MKILCLFVVIALGMIGCKNADDVAPTIASRCLHAGDGLKAGTPGSAGDYALGSVVSHCMKDNWSDAVIACVTALKHTTVGVADCERLMTDEQRAKIGAETTEFTKPRKLN